MSTRGTKSYHTAIREIGGIADLSRFDHIGRIGRTAVVVRTGVFRPIHGPPADGYMDHYVHSLFNNLRSDRLIGHEDEKSDVLQISWGFNSPETDEVCVAFILKSDEEYNHSRSIYILEPGPNDDFFHLIKISGDKTRNYDGAKAKDVDEYSFEAVRYIFTSNGQWIGIESIEDAKEFAAGWLIAANEVVDGTQKIETASEGNIEYFGPDVLPREALDDETAAYATLMKGTQSIFF